MPRTLARDCATLGLKLSVTSQPSHLLRDPLLRADLRPTIFHLFAIRGCASPVSQSEGSDAPSTLQPRGGKVAVRSGRMIKGAEPCLPHVSTQKPADSSRRKSCLPDGQARDLSGRLCLRKLCLSDAEWNVATRVRLAIRAAQRTSRMTLRVVPPLDPSPTHPRGVCRMRNATTCWNSSTLDGKVPTRKSSNLYKASTSARREASLSASWMSRPSG